MMMKRAHIIQTVFAAIVEIALASDIIWVLIGKEISTFTFVCIAVMGMVQTAHCLLLELE